MTLSLLRQDRVQPKIKAFIDVFTGVIDEQIATLNTMKSIDLVPELSERSDSERVATLNWVVDLARALNEYSDLSTEAVVRAFFREVERAYYLRLLSDLLVDIIEYYRAFFGLIYIGTEQGFLISREGLDRGNVYTPIPRDSLTVGKGINIIIKRSPSFEIYDLGGVNNDQLSNLLDFVFFDEVYFNL